MNKPTDNSLYDKIKKRIYKKNPKHSAYRSGILVKTYKKEFLKKYGKKKIKVLHTLYHLPLNYATYNMSSNQ